MMRMTGLLPLVLPRQPAVALMTAGGSPRHRQGRPQPRTFPRNRQPCFVPAAHNTPGYPPDHKFAFDLATVTALTAEAG